MILRQHPIQTAPLAELHQNFLLELLPSMLHALLPEYGFFFMEKLNSVIKWRVLAFYVPFYELLDIA